LAELIRATDLIVWDEAPIMHKYVFEAVNRTLHLSAQARLFPWPAVYVAMSRVGTRDGVVVLVDDPAWHVGPGGRHGVAPGVYPCNVVFKEVFV